MALSETSSMPVASASRASWPIRNAVASSGCPLTSRAAPTVRSPSRKSLIATSRPIPFSNAATATSTAPTSVT